MRSTFMGLEASRRGLFTQQSALYTTGHNISNANTDGYSRQRVNMEPTLPYPGVGLNQPKTTGYIGTGVFGSSVQRIRDFFTDNQYRQETTKLNYWDTRKQAITKMEDVLNEPSDYGLSKTLNDFWGALEDLNVHPEDGGARKVVIQRATAVADSFEYMNSSITQIKENAAQDISANVKDINSILKQIASINDQIQVVEPNGYMPNDLYDARDLLLDELSQSIPIETKNFPTGGNALDIAEGTMTVSLRLKDGSKLKLVDGKEFAQIRTTGANVASDKITPTGPVEGFYLVKVDANGADINLANDWSDAGAPVNQDILNFSDIGKLKSLINSYGYIDNGTEKGLYPDMINNLNKLAKAFAEEFNRIHMGVAGNANYPIGSDIYGNAAGAFFINKTDGSTNGLNASNLAISNAIIADPGKIAASSSTPGVAEPGNGSLALKLAAMKFSGLTDLADVSVQTFFEGVVGQLGVDGQQAERLRYNTETLQQAVTERRSSVSSVSLDEEMTNMITFQKAYNANARMITVVDETLDKIINGMGRVGL